MKPAQFEYLAPKTIDEAVSMLNQYADDDGKVAAAFGVPAMKPGIFKRTSFLVKDARVAVSPGVGFGPGGEGFVRFALIENEQRIGQAVRNLRRTLTKL